MTTPFRGIVQESYDGYGNIRVDNGPDGQPVHMPPSEVFAPNWTLFDVIENEAGIFECWIRFAGSQGQFEWQVYDFAAKRSIAGSANDFAFPARMQCRRKAREIAEWWADYILPEREGCVYCYEGSPQPCAGHTREEKYIIARTWVGEALDQQFD